MTRRYILLTALLLAGPVGLSGCSSTEEPPGRALEPGLRLDATLVTPHDVKLNWRGTEPGVASRIVEFATEPAGQYTILQFVPPAQTTYEHPDLMPSTPFYYRVRPVHGPATNAVDVNLPPGELTEKDKATEATWVPPATRPAGRAEKGSVRAGGGTAAAPTDLKATVMHANGVKLTWTDHSTDEEGFLVEVKPAGRQEYGTAAVLDPDMNSYGLITLPTEKRASYRVRAFYYGKPSNVVQRTTGPEAAPAETPRP